MCLKVVRTRRVPTTSSKRTMNCATTNGNWTMEHCLKCATVCVDQPNNYAHPSSIFVDKHGVAVYVG